MFNLYLCMSAYIYIVYIYIVCVCVCVCVCVSLCHMLCSSLSATGSICIFYRVSVKGVYTQGVCIIGGIYQREIWISSMCSWGFLSVRYIPIGDVSLGFPVKKLYSRDDDPRPLKSTWRHGCSLNLTCDMGNK